MAFNKGVLEINFFEIFRARESAIYLRCPLIEEVVMFAGKGLRSCVRNGPKTDAGDAAVSLLWGVGGPMFDCL